MFEITRALAFCYGHRLLGHNGKCAFLHGHNARVELTLAAPALDALGMVADFQVIRERLGSWIDAELDHRMILHHSDPALPLLRGIGEPVVAVDFSPTAEQLAKLLFEKAEEMRLAVSAVRFWETPTCWALYRS